MSDKDKDKDGRETKVTLLSEDGIKFPVSLQVVRCIGLFRNLLELHAAAGNAASTLPTLQVPNVTSLILDKIVEYLDNYVSAREFSTVTRKRASDEGKTTVAHIVSSVKKDSVANDDDYDDDDGDHLPDGRGGSPAEETLDDGEFDVISDDEDVFDFANYDEQRLCLFTPYEQNFFASLDIPTIIEITKVRVRGEGRLVADCS